MKNNYLMAAAVKQTKAERNVIKGWPSKEKRKELKSLLLHPSVWESESLLEEVCFYWHMLTISLLAERIEHTTFSSFLTIQPTLYLFRVFDNPEKDLKLEGMSIIDELEKAGNA